MEHGPSLSRSPEGKFIKLMTQRGVIDAYYHEAGEGRDCVILLQTGGAGTTAYMCWYLNIPVFAQAGYHVYAPDVMGYGLTELVSGQANRIEFILAFMDAMGVERAHFMGNSMGSMMITQLAIEHPNRVKSLILTGGEPRVDTEESRAIAKTLGQTARMNFVREMLSKPEVSIQDMTKATADFFCDRNHSRIPEVAEMRIKTLNRPAVRERERDAAFRQIERGRSNFRSSDMAKIQVPTYLVHGRDERFFFTKETAPILIDCAIKACFVIPNCNCTVLSNCGHWPQIERADIFNALSLEFLRSLKQ